MINKRLWLGFLIATACVIYVLESLIMRVLPLPFIRLGLSNIIVLYLLFQDKFWTAMLVNLAKTVIGGIFTFTLINPGTVLSLLGGMAAILLMYIAKSSRAGFSIYGISVLGAVGHNLMQLIVVKYWIIPSVNVFVLTPILVLLGMVSGMIIAYLTIIFEDKIKELRLDEHE